MKLKKKNLNLKKLPKQKKKSNKKNEHQIKKKKNRGIKSDRLKN
jgi:hypothetical protein